MMVYRLERVGHIKVTPFKNKTRFRFRLQESGGIDQPYAIEFDLGIQDVSILLRHLQTFVGADATHIQPNHPRPAGKPVLRVVTNDEEDD